MSKRKKALQEYLVWKTLSVNKSMFDALKIGGKAKKVVEAAPRLVSEVHQGTPGYSVIHRGKRTAWGASESAAWAAHSMYRMQHPEEFGKSALGKVPIVLGQATKKDGSYAYGRMGQWAAREGHSPFNDAHLKTIQDEHARRAESITAGITGKYKTTHIGGDAELGETEATASTYRPIHTRKRTYAAAATTAALAANESKKRKQKQSLAKSLENIAKYNMQEVGPEDIRDHLSNVHGLDPTHLDSFSNHEWSKSHKRFHEVKMDELDHHHVNLKMVDPEETAEAASHLGPGKIAAGAAGVAGATAAGLEVHHHYNVAKADELDVVWEGEFSKIDTDKRQVFGWASISKLNGQTVVDRQGDCIEPDEVEKAAYNYVLTSRVGGDMHRRITKADAPHHASDLIESMVFTPEKIAKMGLPSNFPVGWWVGFKVNDENTWQEVKKGKRTGFSIHGRGKRVIKNFDEIQKNFRSFMSQPVHHPMGTAMGIGAGINATGITGVARMVGKPVPEEFKPAAWAAGAAGGALLAHHYEKKNLAAGGTQSRFRVGLAGIGMNTPATRPPAVDQHIRNSRISGS